jgi:hypothetical protein
VVSKLRYVKMIDRIGQALRRILKRRIFIIWCNDPDQLDILYEESYAVQEEVE